MDQFAARDKDEVSAGEGEAKASVSLEKTLRGRLRAVSSASERRTIAGLARALAKLPAESARAALEVSAQLAGVSLRAGVEFLRAAPDAARVLEAEEVRQWGEMGRRLTLADVETGVAFFAAGVAELIDVPPEARPRLFHICARQLTLSTSIAVETFRRAPALARELADAALLSATFAVAEEIARRSAKHSADFLAATPRVFAGLAEIDREGTREIAHAAVRLANSFAVRAGGIASDVWEALPEAVAGLTPVQASSLFRHAGDFLERGGAAALHVFVAGGAALRATPEVFEDWVQLLHLSAAQGNAVLVALTRASPAFFRSFAGHAAGGRAARSIELSRRVVRVACEVAHVDAEAALSCFRSGPEALRAASIEQFEAWAREGLTLPAHNNNSRARRSYYALETRLSNEKLRGGEAAGVALGDVAQTLRLYVEGLTGRAVEVQPLAAVPDEARIGDGNTIHLPAHISEFDDDDDDLNFRLYKVLAAHAAGQIEFDTHEPGATSTDLRAAYAAIADLYAPENADALDAFALDGYINDLNASERALDPAEEARRAQAARRPMRMPKDADYRAVLSLFPLPALAGRIFGTLENARVDCRLRRAYRGLNRDLDLVQAHLRRSRPRIAGVPVPLVPFELLFQITLCGGALADARAAYSQVVSELEGIVADYLTGPTTAPGVADTLMATSRVYNLFQSVVERQSEQQQQFPDIEDGEATGAESRRDEAKEGEMDEAGEPERREPSRQDARELFNAWANSQSSDADVEQQLAGAERWAQQGTSPEQELEPGETEYSYDEWDRELSDLRVNWCRVVEKKVRRGDRTFVELTRSRYKGVISSIRHQFQLMRPENLVRVRGELDGDDYDLDAVVNYVADRRADGQQSERLYTKRLRRERDVAVSFLLDQSSSTARTIGRHPLQPYTHPGRRIIEVEKEGLVLMSEALEAAGDVYAIYGFTSEGRRNVKFYVIKDFAERYGAEIERRIGGINYQHNTRLGAAIRHAAAKLQRQEARTRLLIVLSDGRPYDHDYGDARYAREDTREALREARLSGITPFCITIDRDSEAELRDLYGAVGYTIIDDVLNLPERLPAIYRRLTT